MFDKSTDHGNDVMVPFQAISSLRPGSALWEKGEKIGVGEKKKNRRPHGKGSAALSPSPGYRSARFAYRYFFYLTLFFGFFSQCGARSQAKLPPD